jgi:imidazolonepropionase
MMNAEVKSASQRGGSAARCDRVWRNARLATFAPPDGDGGGFGEIEDGVIASRDGRIAFVGAARDAPSALDAEEIIDCAGRWITPGFIDCHTHLVYAGDRAQEFERRLNGESYESIARSGGGIAATVQATRAASEQQLVDESLPKASRRSRSSRATACHSNTSASS